MEDDITMTKRGDNMAVSAVVAYQHANPANSRKTDGRVKHTIVLAPQPDSSFEIVGIQEQPVRGKSTRGQSSRRRASKKRSSSRALTPFERSMRKFFRGR